jgi:uncharacterized protein (TIGR00304 family)
MRFLRLIGVGALVAGAALTAVGMYQGDVVFALILIFPVLVSTGGIGALGMILLAFGVMALMFELFLNGRVSEEVGHGTETERTGGSTEFGGVVLIGPVPIIFGSTPRTALIAAAVAIIILAIVLLMVLG